MNIEAVRFIDRWIGVPFCFALSGVRVVSAALRRHKKNSGTVRKIAFIKLSELGAIILAYPLMASVRKEYPGAEFFFVTFDQNKDFFTVQNDIVPEANVLTIRATPFSLIPDTLRAISRLRRERVDIIFDLEFFSRFSVLIAYAARAEKRAGFHAYTLEGLYRGDLLTHRIQYNLERHVAENYVSLGREIARTDKHTPQFLRNTGDGEMIFPKYASNGYARERLFALLRERRIDAAGKRLFLINPGEGVLPLREWPVENFILLSRRIASDPQNYIIVIGSAGAAEKAGRIVQAVRDGRCADLSGRTGLAELLELFTVSDALISNDCGLAHVGMLTPVKKFIIFGPESPRAFGPPGDNTWFLYSQWPCSPCFSVLNHRKSACTDNVCLKAITPEYVVDVIMKHTQLP